MNPLIIAAIAVGGTLVVVGLILELTGGQKPVTDPDNPAYMASTQMGRSTQQSSSNSGLLVVIVLVAAVVLVGAVAVFTDEGLSSVENLLRGDPYENEMGDICQSLDGSVDTLQMPQQPGPWKVAVVNSKGDWHSWYKSLPADRKATDVESTDVLACVSGNRELIKEDCPYTSDGRGVTGQKIYFTIRRITLYNDVFLVNPQTQQTFRIIKVYGGEPPLCPDQARKPEGINKERGSKPRYDTFYNQLLTAIR